MSDYRKFLGKQESKVLPYFGGARVHDISRSLRVEVDKPAGWYRFELKGRVATPLEPSDPPDLGELPAVRGHYARGWLFAGGRELFHLELLPAEEPPVLAPVVGRRWPSGELVFDAVDLEGEAEDLARRLLEDEHGIDEVPGVGAALRAAFGFALAARVGERLEIPISPREAMRRVLALASEGRSAAEALLAELEEERRLERIRVESWRAAEGRPAPEAERPERGQRGRSPMDRAARALESAGAEPLGFRSLGNGLLEVTYRYLGERFISVADEQSLQVVDAGICLSGSDRMVTLESLPSVIREGWQTDQLNITRR